MVCGQLGSPVCVVNEMETLAKVVCRLRWTVEAQITSIKSLGFSSHFRDRRRTMAISSRPDHFFQTKFAFLQAYFHYPTDKSLPAPPLRKSTARQANLIIYQELPSSYLPNYLLSSPILHIMQQSTWLKVRRQLRGSN